MKRLISFVLVCVCASAMALAQKKDIVVSGAVQDKTSSEPVMQATVQLLTVKDSAFVAGNVSDLEGKFSLPAVAAGNYLLKVSYTGYVPEWKTLKLTTSTNVGTIALTTDAVLLKQATVTAELAEVQVVEDTVVYNAGAYRVPEGSMLEELVKKLPGAEVDESGKITINGKEVKKIMMNGKEFFSGDTETAMKNVPVDMVEKIKAYDKQSDLARVTGIDDGEEETVLDLSVKKGMNQGWFGNVDLGYGTKDRYAARGMINRFREGLQISAVGNANNVGGRGFPGGGGGFRGGGGGNGLNANKDAGLNFAWENEKIELGGDVRYRHRDSDSRSKTASETFLQSGNSYSNSRSVSLGCSENVEANFRLEWEPDTMTNIIFRPRFTYNTSENWSENTSATFNDDPYSFTNDPLAYMDDVDRWINGDGDTALVNTNKSKSMSSSESWNASGSLQFNRRLNSEGRNITVRGSYSYSDSDNETLSASDVNYVLRDSAYSRNRYNLTPGENWNYSVQATYSEPIFKQTYLQFSYKFTQSYNKSDRSTYDFSEAYPDFYAAGFPNVPADYRDYLDANQSKFAEYYNYTHEAEMMLRVNREKYQLNVGFTVLPQSTKMKYKYLGVDTTVTRHVTNFTPRVRFRYRWSKQHQLDVHYRGRSSQPSMTDLLPITDNSDPLNITMGNPGLKPSFSHNLRAHYRNYIVEYQRGIFAMLGAQMTQNNVSSKVTYDTETGGRITRPENINGNWSADGMFGFNTALSNKKFTVSTFTRGSYNNSVQYLAQNNMDSKKNTTRSINMSENLRGTFRNDWFEVSLNGSINYQHAENELQPDRNLDTYSFSYGASTNITMPWGTSLSTDLGMNSRRGYEDASMNTNELLWNAQVSHSFLKGKAATISLQFYDILHEQSNISRTINAAMRRDTEYNSITSYCMLHFIYKLNIFGDGAARANMRGGFRGGPGGPGGGPGGFRPF